MTHQYKHVPKQLTMEYMFLAFRCPCLRMLTLEKSFSLFMFSKHVVKACLLLLYFSPAMVDTQQGYRLTCLVVALVLQGQIHNSNILCCSLCFVLSGSPKVALLRLTLHTTVLLLTCNESLHEHCLSLGLSSHYLTVKPVIFMFFCSIMTKLLKKWALYFDLKGWCDCFFPP